MTTLIRYTFSNNNKNVILYPNVTHNAKRKNDVSALTDDKFLPFIEFYFYAFENEFGNFSKFYDAFEELHESVIGHLSKINLESITNKNIDCYQYLLSDFFAKVHAISDCVKYSEEYVVIQKELMQYLKNFKNASNHTLWLIRIEKMNGLYEKLKQKNFSYLETEKLTIWDSILSLLFLIPNKKDSEVMLQ